jgi:hypothetical protein
LVLVSFIGNNALSHVDTRDDDDGGGGGNDDNDDDDDGNDG